MMFIALHTEYWHVFVSSMAENKTKNFIKKSVKIILRDYNVHNVAIFETAPPMEAQHMRKFCYFTFKEKKEKEQKTSDTARRWCASFHHFQWQ